MKYLVLAATLFLFGCAHPLAGPPSRLAKSAGNIPEVACRVDKPCVVHHIMEGQVNGDTTEEAIDWLTAAEKAKATVFVLEINTPGGSVAAGFRLVKRIENSSIPIACVVDGMAASMGFYILQACPMRVMTMRSVLMTHEPSISGDMGLTPNEMKALADSLRALREAMARHCNKRLTTSLEEYREHTDGGLAWWFTFIDAERYHAVDVVVESVNQVLDTLRAG